MAEPMRIRATMAGDVADVKVLMNHPMETGLRKDAKTGQLVPAHFIQEVTATLNGKEVLSADLGSGISKNPYLGFKVKGAKAGDKIVVNWVDNTGDKNSAEAAIG
ncbi:thiosulfate oxidation carrier complex protein SoxZ [Betaproteobacteria bacterium SCN1]|jgi:sulfur-oxidizing protein SoxZ|nr:thiosulfate oxidation carrier complex protein SoxZ [Betaproteobacteria bacterium SCN1]MBN8761527.1 thiosulfate oxidation carrier complex protein SoxZ [Thiobacillus sp.]ODU88712.1 MAG: thiosulfate oxidation carrier complex protein SoxZ [Thiobacillus sp. SCN 65-179]OJW39038.1 MAG: thiosulfate oxidation carrier complex protein SoxZ [Thiobacillus sp. 65-69]